jgi:hypothetical protein
LAAPVNTVIGVLGKGRPASIARAIASIYLQRMARRAQRWRGHGDVIPKVSIIAGKNTCIHINLQK